MQEAVVIKTKLMGQHCEAMSRKQMRDDLGLLRKLLLLLETEHGSVSSYSQRNCSWINSIKHIGISSHIVWIRK